MHPSIHARSTTWKHIHMQRVSMHSCLQTQQVPDTHTHTHKHTLKSQKYTRVLSIWIILSYSKSYSCGLFYCIAARCPQTQYQLCLFPSPHLFLPALWHSFLFLTLSIAFPTPSRPVIYYFFLLILILPLSVTIVRFVVGPISIFSCWAD